MNNIATTVTIISIAVSVIGIIQADLIPPRFNGGDGQNVSTLSTITSTSSSVVSNATSYGGSAIAINGSTSTEPSVKTSAATPDPMNLPLPSRAAKPRSQAGNPKYTGNLGNKRWDSTSDHFGNRGGGNNYARRP